MNCLKCLVFRKLPVVFRLGRAFLPAIPLPVAEFAVAVVVAPFWAMAAQATAFGSNSKTETQTGGGIAPRLFQQIVPGLVMGSLGGSTKVHRGSSRFGVLGAMPPDYDRFPE